MIDLKRTDDRRTYPTPIEARALHGTNFYMGGCKFTARPTHYSNFETTQWEVLVYDKVIATVETEVLVYDKVIATVETTGHASAEFVYNDLWYLVGVVCAMRQTEQGS